MSWILEAFDMYDCSSSAVGIYPDKHEALIDKYNLKYDNKHIHYTVYEFGGYDSCLYTSMFNRQTNVITHGTRDKPSVSWNSGSPIGFPFTGDVCASPMVIMAKSFISHDHADRLIEAR